MTLTSLNEKMNEGCRHSKMFLPFSFMKGRIFLRCSG